MKNNQNIGSSQPQSAAFRARRGFTLIELLVVISIIGILAAFIIPALRAFKRSSMLNQAKGEMAQLGSAIESYKAAYGFYPPGNPGYPAIPNDAMFSPLYFELLGTTNILVTGAYQTLDGSASISDSPATVITAFGVSGFVNCMKPGAGEDAPVARSFISGLNPRRFGIVTNNNVATTIFLTAVGGPDPNYQPFGVVDVNPWRYACPGINNPGSYDLWVQLSIGGKTNLICNWDKQVLINSPLP